MTSETLNNFEQLLSSLDKKPHIIFSKKNDSVEQLLKSSLKDLNDCFIKQQKKGGNKLQELYVNQFDEEQLWSQLKSNDNIVNSKTDEWISTMLSNIDEVTLISKGGNIVKEDTRGKKKKKNNQEEKDWMIEEDNMEAEDIGEDDDAIEEEDIGEEYNEDELDENDFANDDEDDMKKFEELDQFLETEKINLNEDDEDEEGDDDEEGGLDADMIDEDDEEEQELEGQLRKYRLVEDDEEDEDEEDAPRRPQINDEEVEDDVFTKAREDLLGDDNEEEEEVQKKSKDRRGSEIEKLESKLLEKKAWQTQGEVKAGQRPVNSLLEEALDYNITKKTSTRITAEYSGNLEAMIKQRILDEAWDDPIEYALGKSIKETFNNLEEINFEKSERGLGQIYEDEYKKNIMGIKSATPDDENKKEIEVLFKKLSYNLDVLSNLSFTPKPNFESTKIVPNVASIRLEEKTPLGFSTRQTNAPEELFDPKKGQLESKEEFTTAENRAARRKVKRNIRTRNKEKKKKQLIKTLEFKGQTKHEHNLKQKGIANNAKEVKKKNQKSVEFTKSSQFFDNLQKSQDKKKQPAAAEEPTTKRKNYMT